MTEGTRVHAVDGKHSEDNGTVDFVNQHGVVFVRFDQNPVLITPCKRVWLREIEA